VASTRWPASPQHWSSLDQLERNASQPARKSSIQTSVLRSRAFREKFAPTSTCAYRLDTLAGQQLNLNHSYNPPSTKLGVHAARCQSGRQIFLKNMISRISAHDFIAGAPFSLTNVRLARRRNPMLAYPKVPPRVRPRSWLAETFCVLKWTQHSDILPRNRLITLRLFWS
jgi:hypothetical protein